MLEEFHADNNGAKQLYGWGTISVNVWLPSLSELVGHDPKNYNDWSGCYASAMQNVPDASTVGNNSVDKNGGSQWEWLIPFNPSGGAAEIWRLCGSTRSWLRSTDKAQSQHVWAVTSNATISWAQLVTDSHAVHPAGAGNTFFLVFSTESFYNGIGIFFYYIIVIRRVFLCSIKSLASRCPLWYVN